MSDETYNGWTNRETWAVALHINNDQGWQESVLDALRAARGDAYGSDGLRLPGGPPDDETGALDGRQAGEIVREMFEEALDVSDEIGRSDMFATEYVRHIFKVKDDIGSLWRVNWDEIGASFLEELGE